MKSTLLATSLAVAALALPLAAQDKAAASAAPPRPMRELYKDYFPFKKDGVSLTPKGWPARRDEIRQRILLACGLWPLPTKTALNPVIHGRIEREDYTVERVIFESFPGHFVSGNLYRPKAAPKAGKKMPGILCPHGHWPDGRVMDLGADSPAGNEQLAIGAERWENGARSPLQARCVQLARMGCAVFFYDMLGYADSLQLPDHRSGKRPELCGSEPGTFGLYSPMADLRLQSNFGLQTWNSIRAVDFMLGLEGIDSTRLGVTGASGGGTQSMILSAIDERIAASFPCVMVSTAMQGGCTCENTSYLRIGQGNIDIAACTAPRPLGMTAADDWTKELETKGWPDLKALYTALGKPDNVEAHFNIHFKHNYNHVSRTQMYGFFNKHFGLGFKAPVLERDFTLSSRAELTVWTSEHPLPTGDKAGAEHEKALLKHWSADSDQALAPLLAPADATAAKAARHTLGTAWDIIIGRAIPSGSDVTFELGKKDDHGDYLVMTGTTRFTPESEEIACTFMGPPTAKWNGTAVLWLSEDGPAAIGGDKPNAAAKQLIDAGYAIACPALYLQGAERQPENPVKESKPNPNGWQHAACYTFGYNPSLLAHRVHDAMSLITMMKNHPKQQPKRILLAGSGPVAAAAAQALREVIDGAAIDTQGFRFASLTDQYAPHFVPGAVKYGDLPGLLGLCAPLKLKVLGEKELPGVTASYKANNAASSFSQGAANGATGLAVALLELGQ